MKNTKNKGNAATPKKSTKRVDAVETVETDTVVEQTNEPVMEVRGDITAVEDTTEATQVCTVHGGDPLPVNSDNFSPLLKGGFRTICKPCQTAKATEWTTARADLRKAQAQAVKYLNAGIPVLKPSAKEWTPEFVQMTLPHYELNGHIVSKDTEGAVFVDAQVAEEVFQAKKAAQKAARDERLAELNKAAELQKQERAAERAEKKRIREEQAEITKAENKRIRDQKREEKAALAAENARIAKEQREADRVAKAQANAEKALIDAENKRLERERKAQERAEKALSDANAAREAKIDAEAQATLAALKGESVGASA